MAYMTRCKNGHNFIAADIYKNFPDDAPKCPVCYEEWLRENDNKIPEIEFKQYRRKGLSEMRPYILGEDMSAISVSDEDNPETDMGMVARNPKNHKDQWYVARKYFEDNFILADLIYKWD